MYRAHKRNSPTVLLIDTLCCKIKTSLNRTRVPTHPTSLPTTFDLQLSSGFCTESISGTKVVLAGLLDGLSLL